MNSELKKRKGYGLDIGRDRLSELPDEVIVHILSFLPTLDAVRTVLLRRFGNLWTLVHTLDFSDRQFRRTFDEDDKLERHSAPVWWFSLFVRYVLMFYKRPTIEKFFLTTTRETNWTQTEIAEVEMWIRFVLSREAKVLVCQFNYDFWPLSHSLYRSQSLVTLELEDCRIENLTQVHMGSLRTLRLSYVWVDYDSYNNLVSGCPCLQELVVRDPCDLEDLSLSTSSVEKLVFCGDFSVMLTIDCPNLRVLDISMDFEDVEVVDLSSIHELIIDTSICDAHKFKRLLEGCQSAQVVTLTSDTVQLLTDILKQGVAFPQNRWRRVVLTVNADPSCIIFICNLVRNSPCLEELEIIGSKYGGTHCDLVSQEVPSPRVAAYLKIVTMRRYWKNYRSQLQLVEFILKCAVNLDKLVIISGQGSPLTSAQELQFVKLLSNFRRASTNARVVFA